MAIRNKMTIRMLLLACCAGVALTGCVDPIDGTRCTSTPFTVAEVRGDTIVTTTGLRWLEGEPGEGASLDWCKLAAVHYDAYLLDGTRFDSSRDNASPLIFTPGIGGLIDGFEQGVIGMRQEGTRRLIIPPALGFGAQDRRDSDGRVIIPGNSTVIYDIELIEFAR